MRSKDKSQSEINKNPPETNKSARAPEQSIQDVLEKAAGLMNIQELMPMDRQGFVKAIIETPKNSRNKYKFDQENGIFELSTSLKAGMTFPFDFGFIPATHAEDGDPLDILVLMDQPAFPGCLVQTRIIGVLEAEQTENDSTFRNDRLIGVHVNSANYGSHSNWKELPRTMCEQIEEFFVYYNKCRKRIFKPIAWRGPEHALKLLKQSVMENKKKSA